MDSYTLKHILYTGAVIVFLCVMAYMFIYTKRSREREKGIEGNHPPASKEAGIMEAQESLKRERQQKHG